jgi:hypothetical protein
MTKLALWSAILFVVFAAGFYVATRTVHDYPTYVIFVAFVVAYTLLFLVLYEIYADEDSAEAASSEPDGR